MSVTTSEANVDNKTYQVPVRDDIIQTAVKFLQNPNVVDTPLAQKQKFLQKKGLSDQEIQISCEQSGAYALHENQTREPPPVLSQTVASLPYAPLYKPFRSSLFQQIKEIVHNIAVFSAIVYAIYSFYQRFIRPFIFGVKKKKSIEESLGDLEKSIGSSVEELKQNIATVKAEVDKINEISESNTQRHLHDLKSEISTVKGLLLSRKQFPTVSNAPVVPPSIPAWQLASVPTDTDPKSEDLLEIGSGSGSSEPEHATKNSDSSLEIM